MHFLLNALLFIFLLGAIVILFALRMAGRIFRTNRTRTGNAGTTRKTWSFSRPKEPNKVFDKNEGEYVDFEEIRESEQQTTNH